MAKLKEQDIKEALKLTPNPATKKLVLAGVKGSDDFPSLLKDFKWSVAKPYDMALIIIAYYAYCVKSEDPNLKKFGESARKKSHNSFKLLSYIIEGDGAHVRAFMQPYFQIPMNKILGTVIPGDENMLERSKIIANFVKQAKKITSWTAEQKNLLVPLINKIMQTEKMFIAKKKEELKEELEKVKSDFTPGKKEAAKNATNTHILIVQLRDALRSHNLETIQQIIESNPNLSNALLNELHETPLHIAASYGHKRIVNLLLAHNADPNAQNRYGITPLHVAARNGHGEIIELLLQHNADPNIRDNGGETLLHYAARSGHQGIVNLLLAHNADPNAQNRYGITPLHVAARNGHGEIIELLLQHNADPNIRDYRGRTYQDLLPRQPRRIQVADFPQDTEFLLSFRNYEKRRCPICMNKYEATGLCCIFGCPKSEDYPFGHYLCNECAQELLKDNGERATCPTCRAGLKPHN